MLRVPAHLRERALGMLQGGMRHVARAKNCNVRTERRLRQCYREKGWTADGPRRGRPRVTTPAQDWYIRTSNLWDRYSPVWSGDGRFVPIGDVVAGDVR